MLAFENVLFDRTVLHFLKVSARERERERERAPQKVNKVVIKLLSSRKKGRRQEVGKQRANCHSKSD